VALEHFFGGAVPVVHAAAKAVAPLGAAGAPALLRPFPVPEGQEAVLPDLPEVIVINVALGEEVTVDVGAGADAAVDEDGGYVHAGVAEVADVADLLLVSAQVTLAAEGCFHGRPLPAWP